MSPLERKPTDDVTTSAELLRLVSSYQLSQAISVAATLQLADHLAAGAMTSAELATRTGTHAPSLYRLLRALAACGVVEQRGDDQFTLTALGDCLRVDAPHSIHAVVVRHGSEQFWRTWGDLLHCVQTGESAMSHLYAAPNPFAYYTQHPEVGALMAASFTATIQLAAAAVLAAYDFSPYQTVIDIGGGQGQLLATILQAYPTVHGVLFDLPSVTQQPLTLLDAAISAGRCTIRSGDFFAEIPGEGDLYLLSRVLHDWDDAQVLAILQQCHRVMPPQAKLLVIEDVLPDRVTHSLISQDQQLSDLNMLVRTGGRERTEREYRQLFAAAHFAVTAFVPTSGSRSILEVTPQPDV
ncbi:MAG: helix-turn-helix domain-containing protein [Ktedonobacterales bacterium]|nr:helix-turn-helix domain-containing protein [Ktedonobacterales bacterium]